MKNLAFILVLLLFCAVSCKSQTTYDDKILHKQSLKILKLKEKKNFAKNVATITVKDIIKELEYKPIKFSSSPEISESTPPLYVEKLTLSFCSVRQCLEKLESNTPLYNINIYLSQPVHIKEIQPLLETTKGFWNKEVAEFFGNMEVKDIRIYDLEN